MGDLQGLNLLIAEDFEDTQELLKALFESEGALVSTADNGLEAIVRARLESFDAILMDLEMPEMNGMEAASKLRQGGYQGLIIALSAGTESVPGWPSSDFSFQASKPLTSEDMARIKAELLRMPSHLHKTMSTAKRLSETEIGLWSRFLEMLPTQEKQLQDFMEQGNARKISELAHKLRGIGTMAGYPEITNAAAAVEMGSAEAVVLLETIRSILGTKP